jgi:hypothetical protein
MPRKTPTIISIAIIALVIIGTVLWFLFAHQTGLNSSTTNNPNSGFSPFGRHGSQNTETGPISNEGSTAASMPALRLLSATPIGGYGASTTASTTIVRWVDRGRGNIYEAREDSMDISVLSNTILPRVYESAWSSSLSSFLGSMLGDDDQTVSVVSASLIPQATSTDSSSTAPYVLRGRDLPDNIVAYALSPKKDKIFMYMVQNGQGIGYVAPSNGGTATQLFTSPLSQVNVEWPEANTIAITTKGAARSAGYLYFVDAKTGVWTKILGPVPGLSARVSHDAKYVIESQSDGSNGLMTSIYAVASSTSYDAIVRTLADKCVWGNFYKDIVYCAVPFEPVAGTYPDDWYRGTISTVDKIWQVNAATGQVRLVSPVFSVAKTPIDAYNLSLDANDNYLFFMNKDDLSFWSLDLVNPASR